MHLQDLAERFGLELRGRADQLIDGVGTLVGATDTQIAFLANAAYARDLAATRAAAVILQARHADQCPVNALVGDDPYLAYARIAALFAPTPHAPPGVHPTAVIDPSARVSDKASIGPHVVIGAGSTIADGCTLMAGVVVGSDCRLGEACLLYPNVTLNRDVHLGKRVTLHPGCVIGADGFGIAFDKDGGDGGLWEKVPQLGGVRIGDDCEIGANSAVDRGAIEHTVLEQDVRVDNLVQIGHNVHIGAHTAIAGCTAIAGSARIGRYCLLAGRAGINGHVTIADRTTIAADSNVMRDITTPGETWNGNIPAQPHGQWQRTLVRLFKLEELNRKIGGLLKAQKAGAAGENNNDE